jgi:nicotinamide-nucleotide amidase
MTIDNLLTQSRAIGKTLTQRGLTIATAESCTGGLLGHVLTSVSGSSAYYLGGVIAYSNEVKEALLGVQHETLLAHGAVSHETAREMAAGIRQRLGADIGLSTTGIAGPTGGTAEKPVGLVYIGISTAEETKSYECRFNGGRLMVKESTVKEILQKLSQTVS